MAAERMIHGEAAGILRDIDSQPLGKFPKIERVLQLAPGEKYPQGNHQQDTCQKHERAQPFNGESCAQFATPKRAASRWARLSPSSLHSSRAVAPEAFSTAVVSSTS